MSILKITTSNKKVIRFPLIRAKMLNAIKPDMYAIGYQEGLNNTNEPEEWKSYSQWYGWCNGRADGGHIQHNQYQRALSAEVTQIKK